MVMCALMLSEQSDAVVGLLIVVALIALVIGIYLREGRNEVLEQLVAQIDSNSQRLVVHGTLAVDEWKPASFLRLRKSTPAARGLQLQYRLFGLGPQAVLDEVVFDRSRCVVELKRKNKFIRASFSEFSAVRMREISQGRGGCLWHIELVPFNGKPRPFISSVRGERSSIFEHTAPLAKAVSMIMGLPVHVFVAGNIWTPGWPPKSPSLLSRPRL